MRRRGTTVVFSTHDMATAEKMCDRIFMIFKGRKVLDGTLEEIQAQYGFDTVRVRTASGAAALAGIPGVQSVNDYGQLQEVRLPGDPQQFLQQLAVAHGRPSLRHHPPVAARHLRPHRAARGGRSHGLMKNKALIVAVSEFTTLVQSKAFLIGLLMMPVFMGIALGVQKFSSNATDVKDRVLRRRRSHRRALRAAEGGGGRLEPRQPRTRGRADAAAVSPVRRRRSRRATTRRGPRCRIA